MHAISSRIENNMCYKNVETLQSVPITMNMLTGVAAKTQKMQVTPVDWHQNLCSWSKEDGCFQQVMPNYPLMLMLAVHQRLTPRPFLG
jgi:hypothetical protein